MFVRSNHDKFCGVVVNNVRQHSIHIKKTRAGVLIVNAGEMVPRRRSVIHIYRAAGAVVIVQSTDSEAGVRIASPTPNLPADAAYTSLRNPGIPISREPLARNATVNVSWISVSKVGR